MTAAREISAQDLASAIRTEMVRVANVTRTDITVMITGALEAETMARQRWNGRAAGPEYAVECQVARLAWLRSYEAEHRACSTAGSHMETEWSQVVRSGRPSEGLAGAP